MTAFHDEPASEEYSIFAFVTPEEDQVTFCVVPVYHTSPPLGAVTVIAFPCEMVNAASLTSVIDPEAFPTWTLAPVVGVFGMVHGYEPFEAEMFETIVIHVEPLLVEYLIRTLLVPAEVHLIVWAVATFQISPPLGDMTVMPFGAVMLNAASLMSLTAAFEASLMRTRP